MTGPEAVTTAPGEFRTFRRAGVDLMVRGRYGEALDRLDRALELARTESDRIAVWIELADVYRYRGDLGTAETLYRRAYLAAGADPAAFSFAAHHLGLTLAARGERDAAREVLTEALRVRLAEGDPELIESTRTALDTLDELREPLPEPVAAVLGPRPRWSDEHEGRSGGVVRAGGHWVKRGPHAVAEYERLEWLRHNGIRVPEVVVCAGGVLVLADAGVPSLATRADTEGVPIGATMGALLRRLHALPVAGCPFDGRLDGVLAQARRNVIEGLVDADDFDDDNADHTPESVLAELLDRRPLEADLVVAHGDYTPPNVLDGDLLIDVGALGVADRYRDLALAERDLREYGPAEVTAFFDAYGLPEPDRARLEYYRLLDELF
ncbi:phosphotransferase [Nocardia farcinica]|uniref:phosphotransferase n=1 Tax=Nocardia farcinica TaxID=37329 RepID=UPI002B4B4F17|nr:phosphotransferase [Nocardia farcinica]